MSKKVLILSLVALFGAASVSAQVALQVGTGYSDAEVERLVSAFNMSRHSKGMAPQTLRVQFVKKFPKASDVEWESAAGVHEVEFDINFKDYKLLYDDKGTILLYAYDIAASQLPAAVKNAIKAEYPNFRIDEATKVQKGSKVYYHVEVERRDTEVKIVLTAEGKIESEKVD